MRVVRRLFWILVVAAAAVPAYGQPTDRWEKEVAAFEAADRTAPPPKGEIVFVGSSTIFRWDLAASFPDLRTINRGIVSSEMSDATRLVERLVTPHAPRLVVVYAGDNDIMGITSEQITINFERFVRAVHVRLPATRILYIGIKPSPLRWAQVDRMRAANSMIARFCERDDRLGFVDVDHALLGWDEKPRPELYVEDGLHLSAAGYQILTALVRPYLAAAPSNSASR